MCVILLGSKHGIQTVDGHWLGPVGSSEMLKTSSEIAHLEISRSSLFGKQCVFGGVRENLFVWLYLALGF